MLKTVAFLLLLTLFGTFVFLDAERWLDVTEEPVRSEIVACLGGGTTERVEKSIEMVEKGYADTMLLLGESWYNQPYLKRHKGNIVVEIDERPKNTEEEIRFIVNYMKKHRYKSVLIVTDPPHSARVKVLLWHYGEKGQQYRILGSDVSWWNADDYYRNAKARSFVWHEMVKVVYSVIGDWCTPGVAGHRYDRNS